MYPNDAGSVEAFVVGNLYDLVLAKPQLPNLSILSGSSMSDRFEDKETPRYRALRTDPAPRNGSVVLKRPAGCYSIVVTAYSPAMNLGGDRIFVRLPTRIALGEESVAGVEDSVNFSPDRWRLSPAPDTPSEIMQMMKGWWEHTEGGGVKIVWTNGFSGVSVLLAWVGETWRGQATTFWDFGRPQQSARVELHKTPCW